MVRMRLYDANKRLLNLTIRIMCRAEGSLRIFISAPYWLINKTGGSCDAVGGGLLIVIDPVQGRRVLGTMCSSM